MPRRKRSASPFADYDDADFEEDASSSSSRNDQPPIQRNAANARERARMRVLSSAFCRLKTKLPNIPEDTKLSKLDTLRLATIYIKQLKGIVDGEENSSNETRNFHHQSQQSLTWPFTFQQIQNYRQQTIIPPASHYSPHEDWNNVEKYSQDPYRNHNNIITMNNNNNNNNLNNNCLYSNHHGHSVHH